MTVALLTAQACGRCMVMKNLLNQRGVKYQEILISSEMGQRLAEEMSICSAGALIDLDSRKLIGIAEV